MATVGLPDRGVRRLTRVIGMPRLASKHPLVIRVTHWINVPVLSVMVWSGLLIYWAYDPYQIRIAGVVLVKFFPQWIYEALDLEFGLATGMAYHLAFAWLFTTNGLVYVAYLLRSGEWRALVPTRRSFREAWHVVLHDLRLRRQPLPPAKFNAAQRFAYTGVILMGAGSVLTGLAIWKPTQFWWLTTAFGGYQAARLWHFALMIGFLLFVLVHLAQVAKAGWNNFRAMVAGYEVVNPTEEECDAEPAVPAR
jgi:thiosulfate reductase cytochrome b subunit